MSDYIKREDAIKALHDEPVRYVKAICDVPAADVVEVVRCKDCMWSTKRTRSGHRYCEVMNDYAVDDGFCSWAEKNK